MTTNVFTQYTWPWSTVPTHQSAVCTLSHTADNIPSEQRNDIHDKWWWFHWNSRRGRDNGTCSSHKICITGYCCWSWCLIACPYIYLSAKWVKYILPCGQAHFCKRYADGLARVSAVVWISHYCCYFTANCKHITTVIRFYINRTLLWL